VTGGRGVGFGHGDAFGHAPDDVAETVGRFQSVEMSGLGSCPCQGVGAVGIFEGKVGNGVHFVIADIG
jgi:hypothetical protein